MNERFNKILDNLWTLLVSVVTVIYDDIVAAILEGVKNSNEHLRVNFAISRIWMLTQVLGKLYYYGSSTGPLT